MEPRISRKLSDNWPLVPVETPSPFAGKCWTARRAEGPTGILEYEFRETARVSIRIFQLRLKTKDPLQISLDTADYTLVFQLLGAGAYQTPGGFQKRFHERSCNLLIQPQKADFQYVFSDQETSLLLLIRFQEEYLQSMDIEIPAVNPFNPDFLILQNLVTDRLLLNRLSEILFHEIMPDWEDFVLEELTRNLILRVLEKRNSGPFQPSRISLPDEAWFRQMKQKLLATKNQSLPFQTLLHQARISQIKRFRRLLKSYYGISIQELLTEARITEAQTLLRTMDMPVKQVAAQTGFKNIYYFTKIFSAFTGIPPGQYQKTYNK